MRLIQLLADDSEGSELDFHPMITVVSDLTTAAHDRVVRAFRALPGAGVPGSGGLLEAHGVLLDLSSETLEMLGMASDIDNVVSPLDIVRVDPEEEDASDRSAAALDVEGFLARTSPGRYPELDKAREGQGQAREALDILLEVAERSKRDRDEALFKHRRAVAALEAAENPEAASGFSGLSLVADIGDAEDDAEDARLLALEAEIARHEDEIARAERGIEELSSIDTRPIQVLVDAIRNPMPVEYVASDRGQELADEYVRQQSRLGELEAELEAQGLGPATAMRRLEDARAELATAERAMAKPNLLPEDIAELEAAHDEVLEAEQKSSGRGRGQKRLEEAMEHQQAVLDRVGFPTWSAYVMGANLMSIDPLAEQRVDRARADLEAAEGEWARISAAIESDPEHSQLLDEIEEVYMEAFDLLGGDDGRDDLEVALRELKVPKREVTTEELVDALLYQLELVGLDLAGQAVGVDYALIVADAFLAEAAEIAEREVELSMTIAESREAIAAVRTEIDSLGEEKVLDLTDPSVDAEPDEAEDEIAALQEAVAIATEDLEGAIEMFEAREALVDAATQVEAVAHSKLVRIAAELAEGERGIQDSLDEVSEASVAAANQLEEEIEGIDYQILARLAAQRHVSYAGSVPLLLDGALEGVPESELMGILDQLDRMSEAVQIVLLTSDTAVTGWAERAGFERAAVVTAPAAFG